jgi:glycosyltransferase involved in cell wall biosynthesis
VVTKYLITELNKKGIETEVAYLPESTTRYTTKSPRVLLSSLLYPRLKEMEKKVDIVQANSWCSWLLRYVKDKPVLPVCHGVGLGYLEAMGDDISWIRKLYYRQVINRMEYSAFHNAEHPVAVSEAVIRDMISYYRIPNGKRITMIPNGLPPAKVSKKKSDGKKVVFAIGRLAKQKGFEYLVRAVPLIKNKDFRVLIAGTGPEQKNLSELIHHLGVEDKVTLLGSVGERRKESLFKMADIFALTSLWESFGLVALEAMSRKVPIVYSTNPALTEVIGNTGLRYETKDPKALAKAIETLLEDDTQRKKLGQESYKRFMENYTAEKMAEGYIKLYGTVLS